MPLTDRNILVSGASSGIGAALARRYAAAGARVFAVGRDPDRIGRTAAGSAAIVPISADLTTPAGRSAVVASIDHGGGLLDVAVHAAGALGPPGVPLSHYPEQAWREVFEINVTAVHLLHQALVPALAMSPAAVVIGVSSTVGRQGRAGWGMYAVSKHALEGWLSTLAGEFAGRVYSVNPGGTRTPMRAMAVPGEDPASIPTPEEISPIFLRLAHVSAPEPSGSQLEARDWIGRDPWDGLDVRSRPDA